MPDHKNPTPKEVQLELASQHGEQKLTVADAVPLEGEFIQFSNPGKVAELVSLTLQGGPIPPEFEKYAEEADQVLASISNAVSSASCKDVNNLKGGSCQEKHCPVCGGHYKMMVFNHPGPCCELCRKSMNGDHWPSRSTMINPKAINE